MTPETRKTLLGLLDEYDVSLTRIQGEKDLLKSIEERALNECGVEPKAFRAVATALWKDKTHELHVALERLIDLIEAVRGAPVTVEIRDVSDRV